MRGKGRTTRPAPARARITPACAGKRKSCAAQKTSAWDHPRMCGEKLGVALLALAFKGSPPHVRGKVLYGSLIGCTAQDHPRMCGEKHHRRHKRPCKWGSPPHVRGKANIRINTASEVRITPACAGKSTHIDIRAKKARDHPRMCGEKLHSLSSVLNRLGSPPHVRGKDSGICRRLSGLGITPACAGKRKVSRGGIRL